MNNNPIGVFDSGIGGISVFKALASKLPNESITYLADSANCPYGEKSIRKINQLSKKMVNFLVRKDVKVVIVACNTITVISIDRLRKDFPKIPIVGIVPVLKTASAVTKNGKIGVLSTKITAESEYQKKLINYFCQGKKMVNKGSSNLVELIEIGDREKINKALKKELKIFKKAGIDCLALGCSHFPLIKREIIKELPSVKVLDSANAVVRQVKRVLKANKTVSNSNSKIYNFYTTGEKEAFEAQIKRLLKGKLTINAKIERISL